MRRLMRLAAEVVWAVPAIIGYHVVLIWPTRHAALTLSLDDDTPPVDKTPGST